MLERAPKRLGSQPQSLGTGRKVGCEPVRMALHTGNETLGTFPTISKKKSDSLYAHAVSPLPSAATAASPEPALQPESSAPSMLDEPSLSRQWIVRRLQRALGMEQRHASLWAGMAGRAGKRWDSVVRASSESAAARAATLVAAIEELGSAPYPTVRIAGSLWSAAGWLLGTASRRAAVYTSRRAAAHALAEYVALSALVDGAAGVPESFIETVSPLLATAVSDAARFHGANANEGGQKAE